MAVAARARRHPRARYLPRRCRWPDGSSFRADWRRRARRSQRGRRVSEPLSDARHPASDRPFVSAVRRCGERNTCGGARSRTLGAALRHVTRGARYDDDARRQALHGRGRPAEGLRDRPAKPGVSGAGRCLGHAADPFANACERRPIPPRHGPRPTRRRARLGAGAGRDDWPCAVEGLLGRLSRPHLELRSRLHASGRRSRRQAGAPHPARDGGARTAHRRRERRDFVAGPWRVEASRNGHPHRGRRELLATDSPAADRRPRARAPRWRSGPGACRARSCRRSLSGARFTASFRGRPHRLARRGVRVSGFLRHCGALHACACASAA